MRNGRIIIRAKNAGHALLFIREKGIIKGNRLRRGENCGMGRYAECRRSTRETEIEISLDLDGTGEYEIDTGIGFFDHMLEGVARHGLFDLSIQVRGDVHVDSHHTVEDTGIVLGQAFLQALGDKDGITRFGHFILPMDDALVLAALDFSGRAYFAFDAQLKADRLGTMETEVVKEFFMGLANGAQMNLHIRELAGENTHHIVEAMFKATAKAMDMASRIDGRIEGVLSTKGML